MSKILKNTTVNDIDLTRVGILIPANNQVTFDVKDFIQLATLDSVNSLTSLINLGDIVVNDGTDDLLPEEAIAFISYPDDSLSVRFDNSGSTLVSKNVEYAIKELEDKKNFSFKIINASETITIPLEQQMIVSDQVRVDGELFVDGEVYVIDIKEPEPPIEIPPDNFSYYNIPTQSTVIINNNQEMFLNSYIKIDGNLLVRGQLAVGATTIDPPKRLKNKVLTNESFVLELNEEYYFRNFLSIDGQVSNNGFITIGV